MWILVFILFIPGGIGKCIDLENVWTIVGNGSILGCWSIYRISD